MNDTPRYVGVAARRSGVAGTGTAVTVGRAVGDGSAEPERVFFSTSRSMRTANAEDLRQLEGI